MCSSDLGIGGVLHVLNSSTGLSWIIVLDVAVLLLLILFLMSVAMPKFKIMQERPEAERIAAHPKVKATGVRKVIGITAEGVFAKIPAEISYMDANCTKWSYATPTTGRMPESGKEVAMDTAALSAQWQK